VPGGHGFDPSLLPDLSGWQSSRPPSLREYLSIRGDYELAVAFATLFWPEFVEVDGCVLLGDNLGKTTFEEWSDAFEGDRAALKASYPDRAFTVDYAHEPDEYGPTVTFWPSSG
jgi:hypothetical protein